MWLLTVYIIWARALLNLALGHSINEIKSDSVVGMDGIRLGFIKLLLPHCSVRTSSVV